MKDHDCHPPAQADPRLSSSFKTTLAEGPRGQIVHAHEAPRMFGGAMLRRGWTLFTAELCVCGAFERYVPPDRPTLREI